MGNVLQTSKCTVSTDKMFVMYGSGNTRLIKKCAADFKMHWQDEYNVCHAGQTTVDKKSTYSLCNPNKWHGPQTPLKMLKKIPLKFHDKAVHPV